MASDHRYYKRFNFESVPMEDYEVHDVSRRLIAPDLSISFRTDESPLSVDSRDGTARIANLRLYADVVNRSPAAAMYALFTCCLDARLQAYGTLPEHTILIENILRPVHVYHVEWRGRLRLPIWQMNRYKLSTFNPKPFVGKMEYYLFWEAHATEMRRKSGVCRLFIGDAAPVLQHEDLDWQFTHPYYHSV